MRDYKPYDAGEYRDADGKKVLICGHIWWPVEKVNAYHCMVVDDYGEPKEDKPKYIWDHSLGKWPVFTPKVAA